MPDAPPLLASASDDADTKVWDQRVRRSVATLGGRYPVLAVAIGPGGEAVYTGGVDNVVRSWDLRKPAEPALTLAGHSDSVTGLAVAPGGAHVLSNGMDGGLRVWDVRPYAPADRCSKVLAGHSHGYEKNLLRCAWSPDGSKAGGGWVGLDGVARRVRARRARPAPDPPPRSSAIPAGDVRIVRQVRVHLGRGLRGHAVQAAGA